MPGSPNASFAEAAKVAISSLKSSKLRSFLTLLGIILATTTLIAVMSVIRGMDEYIANTVSNMGVDGFRVRRMVMIGQWDPKKFLEMQRKNPQLSREEFAFLRREAKLLRELGMEVSRQAVVTYGAERLEGIELRGVSANVGVITNVQIAQGRFLAESDDTQRLLSAVIGHEVKERFFPNVDPIGKSVILQGRPFTVVGVAKEQGSAFGQSRDRFVLIPVETYFKMFGSRTGIGYAAVALDRGHMEQAQDEVRSLLRAWRHVRPGDDDNFGLFSSDSILSAWDTMTGAIAATAVAIVSVFMVVGGVVIMNIMLAVVTERTHEIGIRKSVGARRKDILNQFLVESSVLSGVGGVIGVTIAWAVAVIVRNTTPVPMAVPVSAVAIAVGLSTLVGLFFGIYPARQAARLDPIEALRADK
ncbi:MAG TPA: ABC transporter permease [Bryobacteraceae bacterium]|nr:ABC transporter permease [Bryobacteraceae bacterium]